MDKGQASPTRVRWLLTGVAGAAILATLCAYAWMPRESELERLVRILRTDPDAQQRGGAARALGELGPEAKAAVPAIVSALNDDGRYLTTVAFIIPAEHYVSQDACAALKKIGGPETALALGELLPGADWRMGRLAGEILPTLGSDARAALPGLMETLRGNNQGEVVKTALTAIASLDIEKDGEDAKALTEILPRFLNWPAPMSQSAAFLLIRLNPGSDVGVSAVVDSLARGEALPDARLDLALRIAPDRAAPLLLARLETRPSRPIVDALGGLNPVVAVPALRKALLQSNKTVSAGAADAVALMGAKGIDAAPELNQLLADEDRGLRTHAAIALVKIGSRSDEVVDLLVDALASKDAAVRSPAESFWKQIGPADSWAIPHLAAALPMSAGQQRLTLVDCLQRIGVPAKEALPALLDLLKEDDKELRIAVAKAVATIDKK